jgi:hypothetical protein
VCVGHAFIASRLSHLGYLHQITHRFSALAIPNIYDIIYGLIVMPEFDVPYPGLRVTYE